MDDPSMITSMLSVVILIFILLAAWLVSRYAARHMQRFSKSRYMEIIDQMPVGKDRSVLLLKAGERVYMVGSTTQGMQMIAEMPADALREDKADPGQPGFGIVWRQAMQKVGLNKWDRDMHNRQDGEEQR